MLGGLYSCGLEALTALRSTASKPPVARLSSANVNKKQENLRELRLSEIFLQKLGFQKSKFAVCGRKGTQYIVVAEKSTHQI